MAGKRTAIIYNPMSGRLGRRADDVRAMVDLLQKRGVRAEAFATTGPNDATRLAREAVAAGAEMIVSYGGDGTLNEVIQGMIGSRASLVVWAGGTANVVARDLGMPSDIKHLADVIAAGKTTRITLGLARSETPLSEHASADDRSKERYFFMFAGIGLDASIARSVNAKLKRRTGEFAFWISGLKHLVAWQAEVFTLDVDGEKHEGVFALIGNGKGYGGGFCMTPGAKLDDPWFEVYIVPRRSNNLVYLRDLAACARGSSAREGIRIIRGRHIKANSTEKPWVEVDGEIIGPLPMQFDAVPDALSIIVP